MSDKPPKPKKVINHRLSTLRRERKVLADARHQYEFARPKVKFTPEQLKTHLAKRKELLEIYDQSISKKDKQIKELEEDIQDAKERIKTEGIANTYTRRNRGGRKNKSRRRI